MEQEVKQCSSESGQEFLHVSYRSAELLPWPPLKVELTLSGASAALYIARRRKAAWFS